MDTYFYCSYEHSRSGFFHTFLQGNQLFPVEGGHSGLPEELGEFFSYDRFLFLWRDFGMPVEKPWRQPEPTRCMLGIRGLTGRFSDGRGGTVNMAFYAPIQEEKRLRRIALAILGDFDAFQDKLLGWFSAGGDCGYKIDGENFNGWVEQCANNGRLRILTEKDHPAVRLLQNMYRESAPRIARDLLHFAVCTGSWKDTYKTMGDSINWYLKPQCALTREEFSKVFQNGGELWRLEPAE